jgi:diguanylate cyclase (GGDEF)-like protein/PAS domain S-box-containing protein
MFSKLPRDNRERTSMGLRHKGLNAQATLEKIARLAARSFRVPIALVQLSEDTGLHVWPICGVHNWTERELSLCTYSFPCGQLLVVPDARKDERFSQSPLVKGPEKIRFFAGAPIVDARGCVLGTLCVLDRKPRALNSRQISLLADLAELAAMELTARPPRLADSSGRAPLSSGEQRYRHLFENATDIVYTHDLVGRFTAINKAAERITGYSRDELLSMSITDLVAPNFANLARQMVLEQFGGAVSRGYELELISKQSRRIPLELRTHLLFDAGRPAGLMGFGRDLTGRKLEMTARQRAEEELLHKTKELEHFSSRLKQLHRLGTTHHARREDMYSDYLKTGCDILRMPAGIIARIEDDNWVVEGVHPAGEVTVPWCRDSLKASLGGNKSFQLREDKLFPDRAAFVLGAPIHLRGRLYGVVGFCSHERRPPATPEEIEIIELMASSIGRAMLHEQVSRDSLTGLPGRDRLAECLQRAVDRATARREQLAVLFIDLDRLQQVNDNLGHEAGDILLAKVSERIRKCVREDNTLARMGGDEFALILTGLRDVADAAALSQRLLEVVRAPFHVNGYELFLSASLGISLYPKDGTDATTLLRNANAATSRAKHRGKNCFEFFTPATETEPAGRLELESHLHRAIDHGEFQLYYQPQITVKGMLKCLEALLIWDHPGLGRVGPDQFIPIAEENGTIVSIGAWVLQQACRQASAWHRAGCRSAKVAVNVSRLQFERADFVDTVAEALAESALDPHCLELEVTESLVMHDGAEAARQMALLRSLGVGISIDDFGTGYSSLSCLRLLPVDTLKIDRSFLQETGSPPGALPLIETIVKLAHNLGLHVVGEGVETVKQFELLLEAGCDTLQGHLFGRLLSTEEASRLFEQPQRFLPLRRTRRLR